MTWLFYLLLVPFLVLSFFLMLVILIQRGRGGGLSAAFGGAGGNTAFGAKTGDVLTWVTAATFGLFLILAVGLNLIASQITADAKTRLAQASGAAAPANAPSPLQEDSGSPAPTTGPSAIEAVAPQAPAGNPESAPTVPTTGPAN